MRKIFAAYISFSVITALIFLVLDFLVEIPFRSIIEGMNFIVLFFMILFICFPLAFMKDLGSWMGYFLIIFSVYMVVMPCLDLIIGEVTN
jgi:hypothetical protein